MDQEQLMEKLQDVEQLAKNNGRMLEDILRKLGVPVRNCKNCAHRMFDERSDEAEDDPASRVFCGHWMSYHDPTHQCQQWSDKPEGDIGNFDHQCGDCDHCRVGDLQAYVCVEEPGKKKLIPNLCNTCSKWKEREEPPFDLASCP